MSLGTNILAKRKEKNMTQENLADRLGVSRQTVSDWERDIKKPETQNLIDLAKLLGASLDWLCADDLTISEAASKKPTDETEEFSGSSSDGRTLKIAPVMLKFAEKLKDITADVYFSEDKEEGQ